MSDGITITYSGPLWNGQAALAIEAFLAAATKEVADQGVNDVKQVLDSVLKNPTGNYERHIVTERQKNDWVTTDSGVVYGPWLEGVGSRNQTTRFKGYWAFRNVCKKLESKAVDIAVRILPNYLSQMD